MTSRVEICGINTASLPKLTHNETMELIKQAQQGNEESRERFLLGNLRLVLSIVGRFYGKKESVDDLFQVGCVGLLKALNNFNTDYELRFSTYAVPMIIGEIKRFLRDSSSLRVSRSIRDNAYKILQTRNELESQNNNEATLEEIACAIDMPLSDVVYAMNAISNPVSLFDPIFHDGDETIMIMDQLSDEKNNDKNWLSNITIANAISQLSERERRILMLRFYDGKTQIEVSQEVGISQAQVSRLEKNALKNIKKNIT